MKIRITLLLILFTVCTFAQEWKESYEDALVSSSSEEKPIVLVFAGSDWCAPCIKLDKTIWQSDEFRSYSKENYILYKADFPRKKANRLPENLTKQNANLAERFNSKGHFPLVVVLNSDEKVLGKMGYKKIAPSDYITLLNNCLE